MQIKRYRIALFLTIPLIIIACVLAFHYNNALNSSKNNEISANSEFKYYIKEYDSKIGVFNANDTEPFRVIDVYVETLPSVDQMELSDGVMVLDETKLKAIIEDYES